MSDEHMNFNILQNLQKNYCRNIIINVIRNMTYIIYTTKFAQPR